MTVRVAINGFGRIGRNIMRAAIGGFHDRRATAGANDKVTTAFFIGDIGFSGQLRQMARFGVET